MRQRLYSSAFCFLNCLACLCICSCIPIPPPPSESDEIKRIVKHAVKFDKNCQEYWINQDIVLNHPLRYYPQIYFSAHAEKYAGTLVWRDILLQAKILLRDVEYIEIPAGTNLFLRSFFVDAGPFSPDSSDGEIYFLELTVSARADLGKIIYFMGSNGTLYPLPWDSEIPVPPPGTFSAGDIAKLFPGGYWMPKRKKCLTPISCLPNIHN